MPTGFSEAPFFQIQTDSFALFAVDTGVVRRIDPEQWAWLEAALDRARGKTKMAILGHPLYAGGYDTADGHDEFARLHALLVSRGVSIVMAGDTHDLEYYAERRRLRSPPSTHFVNGGGGAYLSFGTALGWPARPATADVGVLSRSRQVVAKDRADDAVLEASRVVVDDAVRRLAVLGRMAVGRLRLQRGAVLPELHRGPRRAVVEPHSAVALRRPRPTALARPLALAAVVVLRRR